MNSISVRLLIATTFVLAAFVALTALSLQQSVHSRADAAVEQRMQGLVYGILGASEITDGKLQIDDYALPDGRLRTPQSGLMAQINDENDQRVWRSESWQSNNINVYPADIGEWRFSKHLDQTGEGYVFSLSFSFSWTAQNIREREFTILLLESGLEHQQQLEIFDRNLWILLLTSALLLLLMQVFVLMWGLKPLNRISLELREIEHGKKELLDTRIPAELKPLAFSLNTLLKSERNRRARYRNLMHDLAHSLKTPLSIMQNLGQDKRVDPTVRSHLSEQSSRMTDIIAYHLSRASVTGSRPLGPPTDVKPLVKRLARSLKKVYAEKQPQFELAINSDCTLRVDKADLMELLGNVMENACKYGQGKVHVGCEWNSEQEEILIAICDNGPGFPEQDKQSLLERGVRADTRVDGQGLGLAVSRELVESYCGKLVLGNSRQLGGACVKIYFSATR